MWEIIKLVIIGLAGGLLGGMGMGGGTLLIPLLVIAGGLPQHTAQAINLIAFVPMAAFALFFHIKNKLVKFQGILFIIIPAVLAAVGAAWLARSVPGDILGRIFGGFLAVLGVITMIRELFFSPKEQENEQVLSDTEIQLNSAEDYFADQKRKTLDKPE